jgi:squalene-hopene/tetraprenyl-beta-curcumene cyclase
MNDKKSALSDSSTLLNQIESHLASTLCAGNHWEGRLSSSALATATAGFALDWAGTPEDQPLARSAADWLIAHQNEDGGWGDTPVSNSNLSATLLAFSFLDRRSNPRPPASCLAQARLCLSRFTGEDSPTARAHAVLACYGRDRTFAVPILTQTALAGALGTQNPWAFFPALPFEAGLIPRRFYRAINLPVVSYALPALLALGLCHAHHCPPHNLLLRALRRLARPRALQLLARLQPDSGGFLEAIPLTAFVIMALKGADAESHPVVRKGLDFLRASHREDGSWPIDTNLATWLTSLTVAAGTTGKIPPASLLTDHKKDLTQWLLKNQWNRVHPFTLAAPGGWAWTERSGGVPDADDTAAALIALCRLDPDSPTTRPALIQGIRWLFQLQNTDGGIPTFCTGWQNLPFDRSAADLTAHALRALALVWPVLPPSDRQRGLDFTARAFHFLRITQRREGYWVPLWFGHPHHPRGQNPVYGTSRVLLALAAVPPNLQPDIADLRQRGRDWLLAAANPDGGWGWSPDGTSGCEETALAIEALAIDGQADSHAAITRGRDRLLGFFKDGQAPLPQPIGFYFASLWYFEDLYPWLFSWAALRAAQSYLIGSCAQHQERV